MPNYTKLFNSIVTSTIWTEDDKTRILWITMLAMSDQNGEVHASVPGLARIAGIDIPSTEKALAAFLSPDPYSRTPDNQGRRIAKIDGGWELLNHSKYRMMASKEDAKAATAARVKRHRDRKAGVTHGNGDVTDCNALVTDGVDIAEAKAKAKAEANTDTDSKEEEQKNPRKKRSKPEIDLTKARGTLEELESYAAEIGLERSDGAYFFHMWEGNGWTKNKGQENILDWKATFRAWKVGKFFPSQRANTNGSPPPNEPRRFASEMAPEKPFDWRELEVK